MEVSESLVDGKWPQLFQIRHVTNCNSYSWSTHIGFSRLIGGYRLRGSHRKKKNRGSGHDAEIFISKMFWMRGTYYPSTVVRDRRGSVVVHESTFTCASFKLLKNTTLEEVEHFLVVATLMGDE